MPSVNESKMCAVCGSVFYFPQNYRYAQWQGKRCCSVKCGSTKRNIEDDAKMVSLYKDGASCREIGELFSMTGTNVVRVLKENGQIVEQYRPKMGGLHITKQGYIRFNDSVSNGVHAGRKLHGIIAELKIGRRLKKNEVVHHVDGNKLNNSFDNLVVMTRGEHTLHHKHGGENA